LTEFQGGAQTQIGQIRALLLDGKFRQAAGVCQQASAATGGAGFFMSHPGGELTNV